MKKRVFCLVLAALCALAMTACGCRHKTWNEATCETPKTCAECGEVEGEALGHSWQDVTCEAPKTCATCGLTEGEALGHNWLEATTEAPITCANCGATEGERIITDPRFTTAATADVQGTWITQLQLPGSTLNLEGFDTPLTLDVSLILNNDGSLEIYGSIVDGDVFMQSLIDYTVNAIYSNLAAAGMDQAAADQSIMGAYGMTIQEYAEESISAIDLNAIAESMTTFGVYYVADGCLYNGLQWEDALYPNAFTLSGDTLTMEEDYFGLTGIPSVFTRASE